MKIFTKREIIPIVLIVLAFILGFYLYPKLPDQIPGHWDYKGEVDAYTSKNFAIFFYPSITLGLYLLLTFIPLIDPLRKNYNSFSRYYFLFRLIFVCFFLTLYFYSLWAGFGTEININYFVVPLFSFLFIFLGLFMPKIKKNYFVGIRNPWTIHSEKVWTKTHQFSGKLFIGAGIISILSLLVPLYSFFIFLFAVILAAIIANVYSYLVFRKIEKF